MKQNSVLKQNQVLINVGHSAYTDKQNKLRLCFSKAQAVRVLRNRGFKRDEAREAVNEACSKDYGYKTLSNVFGVTEVSNQRYHYEKGHYNLVYRELKKLWEAENEF